MSDIDSEENKSFTTRPTGPRARPPLPIMNRLSRKLSPKKNIESKSKAHYKETYVCKKTRENKSNDDETSDSQNNSLNDKSLVIPSSDSEFKGRSPINKKTGTAEQRTQQRKNMKPVESFLPRKTAWKKDVNHMVVQWGINLITLAFIIVCGIGYCYMTRWNKSIYENNIIQFEEDIEYVKKKFPMQMPDIWDDVVAGVKTVIDESSKRPAVFVLLANNSNTIDCLSISLGNVISQSLGGKECLILVPNNFISNQGEMLEWLRPKIKQNKVVVVNDILKINSDAIRLFHWLCDDTNPLVSRAVYLITMTINRLHVDRDNLTNLVEEHIYNTFSNVIHFDILHAAVSRITSGAILPILPEPNFTEGTKCP